MPIQWQGRLYWRAFFLAAFAGVAGRLGPNLRERLGTIDGSTVIKESFRVSWVRIGPDRYAWAVSLIYLDGLPSRPFRRYQPLGPRLAWNDSHERLLDTVMRCQHEDEVVSLRPQKNAPT
ncbi:hypothetical protein E4K72_09685 [Oxalobacteraceae bacterium OM1]|nr:hypothetical protein E4K72_09685 [Oxalobacteraceae bacterium OM1]